MLKQTRLSEIADTIGAASTWVTGTRSTTLVGISEELHAAASAGRAPAKKAAAKKVTAKKAAARKVSESENPYIQDSDTAGAHDDTPVSIGG